VSFCTRLKSCSTRAANGFSGIFPALAVAGAGTLLEHQTPYWDLRYACTALGLSEVNDTSLVELPMRVCAWLDLEHGARSSAEFSLHAQLGPKRLVRLGHGVHHVSLFPLLPGDCSAQEILDSDFLISLLAGFFFNTILQMLFQNPELFPLLSLDE